MINQFNLIIQENNSIYKQYLPIISKKGNNTNLWDIPFTIKELSYFTHSHYRYYGKFPSVVAGQILEQYTPPSNEHYVIDNFCGSGTSLVEAKIRGIKSYGIDISWLSVLVSNVKTRHIDTKKILHFMNELNIWVHKNYENFQNTSDSFTEKWFTQETTQALRTIQNFIILMENSDIKDFIIVGFIGIIRRVSKAHDAEVRPHINKNKKTKNVLDVLNKKIKDMCLNHNHYMNHTLDSVISTSYLANNLSLPEKFNDKKCYLAISHPPYLNSFNYAPVYNLEFYWGKKFENIYTDQDDLYKIEMKAHPADDKITEQYFLHLKECYNQIFRVQDTNGVLAIVIGDCTRNKKIIPVIEQTIDIVKNIGYDLEEINYRTTHYGLGKYAYKHRADYHSEDEQKRDAIIIFRKKS